MSLTAFAPAKINLFLHVEPAGGDGYHPLCSWMTFADVGDRLSFEPAKGGRAYLFGGPFAEALAPDGELHEENLVVRAANALLAHIRRNVSFTVELHKALPVAAGLGGGSADAGATLRLLRQGLDLDIDDAALEKIAVSLGADGAACLWARPVLAQGRGERLSPAPAAPVLDAVLVNPGVPCSTAAVYRRFDERRGKGPTIADRPRLPERFESVADVVKMLVSCRNDLEPPAIDVAPIIGDVLGLLLARDECLLARVSGSGATCFALCADAEGAEKLAGAIAAAEPTWWVRACRLGAPLPL